MAGKKKDVNILGLYCLQGMTVLHFAAELDDHRGLEDLVRRAQAPVNVVDAQVISVVILTICQ